MSSIAQRWHNLQSELETLCEEQSVTKPQIIAVSKTRTEEEVAKAIDAGITQFGENKPKEFKSKAEAFPEVDWHYIGHLQRNDAGDVAPYAKTIHSLDRIKLSRRLQYFDYAGDTYIQVNISGEESKSGCDYDVDKIRQLLEQSRELGLRVSGLMTIGNPSWDETKTLTEFRAFVRMGGELELSHFSIGMSDDWQLATLAGSTHLRIGTAIFGPRR